MPPGVQRAASHQRFEQFLYDQREKNAMAISFTGNASA